MEILFALSILRWCSLLLLSAAGLLIAIMLAADLFFPELGIKDVHSKGKKSISKGKKSIVNVLAREIANSSAWADVQSFCVSKDDGWFDTETANTCTTIDGWVARAVSYLDLTNQIEHHLYHPGWVRLLKKEPVQNDARTASDIED